MRRSKVLAKLRAGKVARICCLSEFIPFFPRWAAEYGYDGIWVDNEHRAFDVRQAQSLIAFHHLADIDCLWRPGTVEKGCLYRFLEDGAAGLIIPHVSTRERAEHLVQATKFPPLGDRGMDGAGLDGDFYVNLSTTYPEDANRETCLIVQIETPLALENVDAIAAVPGVDGLFVGPGDLSLRLHCSPAVDDPKMMEAQQRIARAARDHGKAWGRPVGRLQDLQTIVGLGAQIVVFGTTHEAITSHLRERGTQFGELLGSQG